MATRKLIGTDPDQVPVNGDLGTLAFQDSESVRVTNLRVDGDLTVDGERMRIDSAGNVGIGTSSPAAQLDVFNSSGAGGPAARFWVNEQTIENLVGFQIYTNQSGGFLDTTLVYGNTVNSYLAFGHHNGSSYTERVRIAASGNVGIGISVPTNTLYVAGISATPSLRLGSSAAPGNYWDIGRDNAVTGDFLFLNGAAERMRIDASGHLIVPAGITLGTAAGVYGAANTLDDYEEGTWTPTLGGDATYTSQAGTYTKVGRLVIANCILAVNIIGTGATNNVSGLPFTVRSQAQGFGGTLQYFENLANNVVLLNPSPNPGATTITFYTLAAAGGTTSYNTALWQNSARIDFTVMYFT